MSKILAIFGQLGEGWEVESSIWFKKGFENRRGQGGPVLVGLGNEA